MLEFARKCRRFCCAVVWLGVIACNSHTPNPARENSAPITKHSAPADYPAPAHAEVEASPLAVHETPSEESEGERKRGGADGLLAAPATMGIDSGSAPDSVKRERTVAAPAATLIPKTVAGRVSRMDAFADGTVNGPIPALSPAAPPPAPPAPARPPRPGVAVRPLRASDRFEPPLPAVPPPQRQQQHSALLTAGSVGDADRRANYLDFLQRQRAEGASLRLDLSRRLRIKVIDRDGRPVNDARIKLGPFVEGRTHADGVWDFFPSALAPAQLPASQNTALTITYQGAEARGQVYVNPERDSGDVTIELPDVEANLPSQLDLAFAIDVTGSMEDELRYVGSEVGDIVQRVRSSLPGIDIRLGAVLYRDREDDAPYHQIDFTSDVSAFANNIRRISAGGGGDYPEDMNRGLQVALGNLRWRTGNVARVLTLIADAPPKYYSDASFTYQQAMSEVARRGIRILPVAASGADRTTEYLFRALGSFTSTPYVYLTDDSGIGNPHLDADTDRVPVEHFKTLLTRLVVADLRGEGMHEPGAFGMADSPQAAQ